MPVAIRAYKRLSTRAFTLMEVMVAGLILAVGIMTAMGTVMQSNNLRAFIDENNCADLVLRELSARLQSTKLEDLGHDFSSANTQRWKCHLRATPSSTTSPSVPSGKPLTMQELIDAGILFSPVPLAEVECYIEYYNLRTQTGMDPTTSIPIYNGLLDEYAKQQLLQNKIDASLSTKLLWYQLVGNPELGSAPVNINSQLFIMPPSFNANISAISGINQVQITDAIDHGIVIRVIIAWQPKQDNVRKQNPPFKRWLETLIIKRS